MGVVPLAVVAVAKGCQDRPTLAAEPAHPAGSIRPCIDEFRATAASESVGDSPQIAASRVTGHTSAYERGAQA
jgi:hypothetical protein